MLMTITSITMVHASIDLSNLDEVRDIDQNADCVVVVAGCDGTGSVDSHGDTTIGSNNGDNDANSSMAGEQGPPGPVGPPGPQSVSGKLYTVDSGPIPSTPPTTADASCNAGDDVLSGGYLVSADSSELREIKSFKSDSDTWSVSFDTSNNADTTTIEVFAYCFDNP